MIHSLLSPPPLEFSKILKPRVYYLSQVLTQ